MTVKARKLLDEALALPPEERADIAAVLLDSLDAHEDEGVYVARRSAS